MKQSRPLLLLLNIAVFILLEIASLHMISQNAVMQRIWLARNTHQFMGKVWGATQAVRTYFFLGKVNKDLSQENLALQQEVIGLREQLRKVYTDSLPTLSHPGYTLIPAEVIKLSQNKQHNYLILNRGFLDGIREKSGIITPHGVVGIIDAVSEHHAYGFSFQNTDVSISARLGNDGSSGLLVWDGIHSNGAILKEIPLQSHYQPGDTVFTSGHSLLFPPDIPLGIAGSSKVVNGATNEISVTLFQDYSILRYVSVVYNNDFEEIEEFEL